MATVSESGLPMAGLESACGDFNRVRYALVSVKEDGHMAVPEQDKACKEVVN